MCIIVWFRCDFWLEDNFVLIVVVRVGMVVLVFVWFFVEDG